MLELNQIEKRFGDEFRLGPVTASLAAADTTVILGANGSGKSTLLDIITGATDVSSGQVTLDGQTMAPERHDLKPKLGFLPQNSRLPPWLSAKDLLTFAKKHYRLSPDCDRSLMEIWQLKSFLNRPMSSCSIGMQKRVGLALATIHEPPLLILDEPFAGLDLTHIHNLESLIDRRRKLRQATILVTHILPFAKRFADDFWVLRSGNFQTMPKDMSEDELKSHIFPSED